jgi:hypothetical protein
VVNINNIYNWKYIIKKKLKKNKKKKERNKKAAVWYEIPVFQKERKREEIKKGSRKFF